jgi:hypothetical protein
MFFPFLIKKKKTFVRAKMGGQHNLEKKFMHVANEVNQNAPEKSKFFPIGR